MSFKRLLPMFAILAGCNAVLGNDPRGLDPAVQGNDDDPPAMLDAGNTAIEEPADASAQDAPTPTQDPNASEDAQGPAVIGEEPPAQEPVEAGASEPPAADPPPEDTGADAAAPPPDQEPGGSGKKKGKK